MITIILSLLNNCGYCDNNDSDCGNDYNNKGIYLGTLFLPWHAVAVMKYVWEYIIVCFTFLLLVSFPFFIIVFTFIANCLEFAKKNESLPPSMYWRWSCRWLGSLHANPAAYRQKWIFKDRLFIRKSEEEKMTFLPNFVNDFLHFVLPE